MTLLATLIWGASSWRGTAYALAAVLLVLLLWSYSSARAPRGLRLLACSLKAAGILILILCLLEPLWSSSRPRPGANLFVVMTDTSRSMTLHDRGRPQARAEQVKAAATRPSKWMERVGEDFDLRKHTFDTSLHAVGGLDELKFEGDASNLGASLTRLEQQYHGRPLAGVLLFTDGNATDSQAVDRLLNGPDSLKLPPIYPVLIGENAPADDINLRRVDVSQTDFEDAPVTIAAEFTAEGFRGRGVAAQLLDDKNKVVDQQVLRVETETVPLTARFRLKPDKAGISFYKVRIAEESEIARFDQGVTREATLANNTRLVTVDRGRGPFRILYVAGRPNWEFKFLQRSLGSDDQVQLVGLIRVAKREPRFAYLGRAGDASNPLFRGFENKDSEQTEQYDQPVLTRIGVRDENDLRNGFPRTAEELNTFSAIVIDDLEAEFFTQDQLMLLKEFVRQRGGGLLMLGGQESLHEGKYDRTPVGDVLPVYTSQAGAVPVEGARYRLALTRDGWLSPWVRLRPDEATERSRLQAMPAFQTLNSVRGIKPGATVLATVEKTSEPGERVTSVPALVEQRFGRGRGAALLIGDLWRWSLQRPENTPDDMAKAWRQTIRWLVSDVPRRVELATAPAQSAEDASGSRAISVRVRDAAYAAQDNVSVALKITTPDGQAVNLTAEAAAAEAGLYEAAFVPRQPGNYRVQATATGPDGQAVGTVEAGWTTDPTPDEFTDLRPNRTLLERLAAKTGGQMVGLTELNEFVKSLPERHVDITEPDITPLWHRPWVFLLAVGCLAAEWGLRRWKGLP
jgi:uncharacterized membrane protein